MTKLILRISGHSLSDYLRREQSGRKINFTLIRELICLAFALR